MKGHKNLSDFYDNYFRNRFLDYVKVCNFGSTYICCFVHEGKSRGKMDVLVEALQSTHCGTWRLFHKLHTRQFSD